MRPEKQSQPLGRPVRRAWRRRLRPVWRDTSGPVIVAAALAAVVLGYIGYRHLDYSVTDSLYRALQLFGLGGAVEGDVPTSLEIARILAPLVAGVAVIRAVFALAHERLRFFSLRYIAGNHVIVAGLGAVGTRAANVFHDAGFRVVAVEVDPAARALAGCRERGITVIGGDAGDPEVLRRTRPTRARLLIATCGDDSANLGIGVTAAQLSRSRRGGLLTAFVHLADTAMWQLLALEGRAGRGIRLEPFSLFDMAARMLLDAHPPFSPYDMRPARVPKVLIVGTGDMVDRLVLHLARLWIAVRAHDDQRLGLTIAGPAADDRVAALAGRFGGLDRACDLSAREASIADLRSRFRLAQDTEAGFDIAYVSLGHQTNSLAAALAMTGAPQLESTPIVAAVDDDESGAAAVLREAGGASAKIRPFGVFSRVLTPDLLFHGTTETLAQALHEDYVRNQLERGAKPHDNPSLVPWQELPESLRESNRRFVDGIGEKLSAVGCFLVPDPLAGIEPMAAPFTDSEVEELARMEHDRWSRDLIDDGWSPTTGSKDPERRLHPLLVAWADLPDDEREKDRDTIRALPNMLGRAGLRISRAADPQPSAAVAAGIPART